MKKIIGIGNALTDILTVLPSDDLISKLGYPKGSMQLINEKMMSIISQHIFLSEKHCYTGGSAANTIMGISQLGGKAGIVGKIGHDDMGALFASIFKKCNIKTHMLFSDKPSGRCHVLISADGERTMFTYLGAANDMSASDFVNFSFNDYDIVHVEGYLVQNYELLLKIGALTKAQNKLLSLDLSSFNIVEENLEFLKGFVNDYVDILFANEQEAYSFTGEEPENAIKTIADAVDIAVVKLGKKGAFIMNNGQIDCIEAYPVTAIDTTGAGDLYASGFLYGLSMNLPLKECGKIGSICSGYVIQQIGSYIPADKWKEINTEVKQITDDYFSDTEKSK